VIINDKPMDILLHGINLGLQD